MHRELLIAKRQKAKQLHTRGWSVSEIARHLVSNWRSVRRWIEMVSEKQVYSPTANRPTHAKRHCLCTGRRLDSPERWSSRDRHLYRWVYVQVKTLCELAVDTESHRATPRSYGACRRFAREGVDYRFSTCRCASDDWVEG